MALERKGDVIKFCGLVGVEEAEALLEALQEQPASRIDFSACTHLHAANLQVLMVARPVIYRWPDNKELCAWLETASKSRS